ncbi:MAG TPA: class I SAM-dependent methyltransferase [Dehalococcoidia bacterium]|nr:class I SAM-dependent methyltransferase [Dehalococcoidia bacterium]
MTTGQPWYESFFGQDYLDVYGSSFTRQRAETEAGFAIGVLGLTAGAEVLDLCCGQGRHAVELAKHGCAVTALDLSQEYLELANEAAREAGVALETVRADMREIPFSDRFDAVVNMFSSFGYLESEAEDARVLEAIRRALKPGGVALLDLLNRDWVVANYETEDSHTDPDGTLYLEHRRLDLETSRNHVSFTVVAPDGSRREVDGHHIRLYTLREVRGMLDATTGLVYEGAHGGYAGEPYGIDTRRMIVVARRPA